MFELFFSCTAKVNPSGGLEIELAKFRSNVMDKKPPDVAEMDVWKLLGNKVFPLVSATDQASLDGATPSVLKVYG